MKADEKHIWLNGIVEEQRTRMTTDDSETDLRIVDDSKRGQEAVVCVAFHSLLVPQWVGKKVRVLIEVIE